MTGHTEIAPGAAQGNCVERLIQAGEPTPSLAVDDLLCCAVRGQQDIFIVRQVGAKLIVGSISREVRLELTTEIDNLRPLIHLRILTPSTLVKVVEGGIYQLLSGEVLKASKRRWWRTGAEEGAIHISAKVPVVPRVVLRWAPAPE